MNFSKLMIKRNKTVSVDRMENFSHLTGTDRLHLQDMSPCHNMHTPTTCHWHTTEKNIAYLSNYIPLLFTDFSCT